MSNTARLRIGLRWLLIAFMFTAGVMHFVAEPAFRQIVPPQLPFPREIVWISGIAEMGLALALIPQQTRRWAGYGLIALYVAVFPANIYMAIANVQMQNMPDWFEQPSPLALWLRLPLQLVLIAWAWWVSR